MERGLAKRSSCALIGEVVGVEEMDDQLWHLHFGSLLLGVIDGRGKEIKLLPVPR